MATRVPLVLVNGQVERLQAGDDILAPTATLNIRAVTNGESSAALVIGAPAYVSAAGTVKRAQANAVSTADALGLMVSTSTAAGASGTIGVGGTLVATTTQWDAVTGQTGGLTSGSRYYVDPSTAGKLTATPPDTTGQVLICMGKALSTTEMEVDPSDYPILL